MQSSTRIVGSLVAPVVVTAVAVAAGWRWAMVVSAALLLVSVLIIGMVVPRWHGVRAARKQPRDETFSLHAGGRRNVVLSTIGCVLLLAWLTVWSQSSVPLVQAWLDLEPDAAGRLVGWFGAGSAVAALGLPILSDRIGRRAALALGAGLGGAGGISVGTLAAIGAVPHRALILVLLALSGAAMGGLPLVISIVPAEAVASGDVGRALTGPIAGGEIIGGAVLPAAAAALAVPLGLPVVVALTGGGVLALIFVGLGLRPVERGHPADLRLPSG